MNRWVRAEIMIIRQCAGTMTVESIGKLIGRTGAAIRAKGRQLNIKFYLLGDHHQSVKYPISDVRLARDMRYDGLTLNEIAEKLEMPLGMVKQYVYFERRASA